MIKKTDLRIGNTTIVDGVLRKITAADLFDVNSNIKFDPIPLTPEILEKCQGFSVTGLRPYFDKHAFVFGKDAETIVWSAGHVFKPVSSGGFIKIGEAEYLHQLQNAWPFLTGNELNVSL